MEGEVKAGPEMDRMVAEEVMGWEIKRHYQPEGMIFHAREDDAIFVNGEMRWWADAWSPSTNIAHAWGVAEKLRLLVFPCKDGWAAAIPYDADGEGPAHGEHWIDDSLSHYAEADTAPLAICRCALMAMEKKG